MLQILQQLPLTEKTYQVDYYDLDLIISVGYRVKSQRGVEFRRWANKVLKDYIIKGYAMNDKRIEQIGEVILFITLSAGSFTLPVFYFQ